MKKLMIAAFAVAFAAVAQAASIQWNSGAITLADGTSAGAGSVTAYLFSVDATTYATYSAITEGVALSDAVWGDFGTKLSFATATADSVKKGSKANVADTADYPAGKTAYAVLLYVDKAETPNYMANVGQYTFDAASDWSIENMANFIGGGDSGSSTAWSTAAVPEPTSALMLLVGLAGLALKRKIA